MGPPTSLREVARQRWHAQRLVGAPLASPGEVVELLGAVQSQEFAQAKWSLSQRTALGDATIQDAFDAGHFLRTHVLRPTWHFVHRDDLRWMQSLTAARVRAGTKSSLRRAGITPELATLGTRAIVSALTSADGRHLTRAELRTALERAGIIVTTSQTGFLTYLAELDQLLTSGVTKDHQQTYALLEARAPGGRDLEGDEALAELTRRYVTSHGPATEKDFAWWASLTLTQVRHGLRLVIHEVDSVVVEGATYWFVPGAASPASEPEPTARLVQTFDELLVAYPRSRFVSYQTPDAPSNMNPNQSDQPLVVDAQVVGTWRATRAAGRVTLRLQPPRSLTSRQRRALEEEVARYTAFTGAQVAHG